MQSWQVHVPSRSLQGGGESREGVATLFRKGAAVVVENPPWVMGRDDGEFYIHTHHGTTSAKGSKEEAARSIWDTVVSLVDSGCGNIEGK